MDLFLLRITTSERDNITTQHTMANNTSTQRTLRKPHKKPDVALTTSSTAVLNKKIRDLTRLLSRTESTLPANVRLENERALEAYKHELSVVKASAQAKKLAMKYRQVRFFGV